LKFEVRRKDLILKNKLNVVESRIFEPGESNSAKESI
jgi:hypothetical protein